jgi:hypothetical protein
MANPQHLEILRQGVEVWNRWRNDNKSGWDPEGPRPFLTEIDLSGVDLSAIGYRDLTGVNLYWSNLDKANLSGADPRGANLSHSILRLASIENANLQGANL